MQGELDNSYYIDPYAKVFLTNIKNSVVLVEAFNMFMISVSKQYLEGINSFCVLLCMWSHILLLKTATILTLLHHPLSLIFLYLYLLCQINFKKIDWDDPLIASFHIVYPTILTSFQDRLDFFDFLLIWMCLSRKKLHLAFSDLLSLIQYKY